MDETSDNAPNLADASKRLAHQALVICENRFELLLVEIQEEREQIVRAMWLGAGVAMFSLLAGVALTVAIAVAFWNYSPVAVMFILAAVYATTALVLSRRLARLRRDWQTLPDTLAELRKDRECLAKNLH